MKKSIILLNPKDDFIEDIEMTELNEEDVKNFINVMMAKPGHSFSLLNTISVVEAECNPVDNDDDRYRENFDYFLVSKPKNAYNEFFITQFETHLFPEFWSKKRVKCGNLILNLNDSFFKSYGREELLINIITQIQWDIKQYYQRFGLLS